MDNSNVTTLPVLNDQMEYELSDLLKFLSEDAAKFFVEAINALPQEDEFRIPIGTFHNPTFYWEQLPKELQESANALINQLIPLCGVLANRTQSSPLSGPEDLQDVKLATKTARAALRLRQYHYSKAHILHDEGTAFGFQPAAQSEGSSISPRTAKNVFFDQLSTLASVLKLVDVTKPTDTRDFSISSSEPAKYRTGTAFIMMWMDPKNPELTDVVDTVRSVFKSFGVQALRADDIEHDGLITERVLDEIRTSEFLFADLTGARPNVYYETGYAHALRKRVILFRKSGTGLHFDLAGYNCPEYENQRDLRDKLKKRMVSLTNRNPIEERS